MYDISTYSVSSDLVTDSSTELRCVGSPYVLRVCTLTIHIHATCTRRVEKGWARVYAMWSIRISCNTIIYPS